MLRQCIILGHISGIADEKNVVDESKEKLHENEMKYKTGRIHFSISHGKRKAFKKSWVGSFVIFYPKQSEDR